MPIFGVINKMSSPPFGLEMWALKIFARLL